MRPSPRLLVKPRRPVRDTQPLLPPLVLYRAILRAHRRLPNEERQLGDKYVRAEFRAHTNVEDPLQIVGFLTAWQDYLGMVRNNQEDDWKRYKIKSEDLNKMSDEQIGQLYELMQSTKNLHEVEEDDEGTHEFK